MMWRPDGRFQQILEEKSGGRFKLDVRSQLFPRREVLNSIAEGRAQIGEFRASWVTGTFPLFDIAALPFWWGSNYEWEAFDNNPRVEEIWDAYYRKAGVVKLATIMSTPNDIIWANQEITSLDDFKGLKIRTSGALQTEALRAMGASPLTIPGAEIAEAVARGTVDGVLTSLNFGTTQGLPDLTEFMNVWLLTGIFDVPLIANAEAFDALPPDLREALVASAEEMERQQIFASVAGLTTMLGMLRGFGGELTIVPEAEIERAKEATNPIIADWIELTGPLGEELINISREYASGAR